MTDDELDEAERAVIETIMLLKREHERHLEPFYRQLARFRAFRPPPPVFINKDDPLALLVRPLISDSVLPKPGETT